MKYHKAIGNYYRGMAWIALALCIVTIVRIPWTDSWRIDLSFIVWFWLGSALKRKSPTARKWAIGISSVITFSLSVLMLTGAGEANIRNQIYTSPDVQYYAICIGSILLLGVPGLLLIKRTAKEEFEQPDGAVTQESAPSATP
jgi:hypothetical protein